MWLILLSLEFVTINHQQFWRSIMFSMIMMVLYKSSTILAPNNLFSMIIMPLHTPEIKMGETWQAPQDVPLNDLKLQGGKMMMEKDKTMMPMGTRRKRQRRKRTWLPWRLSCQRAEQKSQPSSSM